MHEDWQCIQCNIVKYDRYSEMSVSLLQFLSFLQYVSGYKNDITKTDLLDSYVYIYIYLYTYM